MIHKLGFNDLLIISMQVVWRKVGFGQKPRCFAKSGEKVLLPRTACPAVIRGFWLGWMNQKRHTLSVTADAATRSLLGQMPLVWLEDFPAFLFE
jgi:hypothetical protein